MNLGRETPPPAWPTTPNALFRVLLLDGARDVFERCALRPTAVGRRVEEFERGADRDLIEKKGESSVY